MNTIVFNKKGIRYEHGRRGEITVINVPAREQVQIFKDMSSNHSTNDVAERAGVNGQIPLWRDVEGRCVVYGVLPEDILQRRQAIKVWLAQDFAPRDCEAFYYAFSDDCIVHGVKDIDDERREDWRVMILKGEPVALITNAISERMLDGSGSQICVAVHDNLTLYEALKQSLKPLSVEPVPFSTLKPSGSKPLYKHSDFTLLMLTFTFFAGMVLAGTIIHWSVNLMQVHRLESQITDVQKQIRNIQINKSLGHIREPENLLNEMQKAFAQQPSAIIDVGARFGAEFGKLAEVSFNATRADLNQGQVPGMAAMGQGEYVLDIKTSTVSNKLLVDQENLARSLVKNLPWIRKVENVGLNGEMLQLKIVVQGESVPGLTEDTPGAEPVKDTPQ